MEETINIDNAFIPDATTRDCYLRVTDICQFFDVAESDINNLNLGGCDFIFIGTDGKVLKSGCTLGCKKGYNLRGIEKIYNSLSLQQKDKFNKIIEAYNRAKCNAGFN